MPAIRRRSPNLVYADGTCENQGRKSAKAGLGVWFESRKLRNLNQCHPVPEGSKSGLTSKLTKRRAQLSAIARAIALAPADTDLIVATDCVDAFLGLNKLTQTWRRRQWTNKKGNKLAEGDLYELCDDLIRRRGEVKTKIQWIPRHEQRRGLSNARVLAQHAILQQNRQERQWEEETITSDSA
ncbi:unnamed protein product [Jaminaea pallidilutea]